jgi:type IV pilus assembly protein PilX
MRKEITSIFGASRAVKVQTGASLVTVLLILILVSVIGVGGAQIAMMSERGARNDRDMQLAWQSSEAALVDAESDIHDAASTRVSIFDSKTTSVFLDGCGTSGTSIGLCALPGSGKPAWMTVDFTDTSNSAPSVALGTFTGNTFASGGIGVQPAQAPRYIIEIVPDTIGDRSDPSYIYRVTSMGFGPRSDIQAVMQMVYRN